LSSVNDIAAVSKNEFYATNDHGAARGSPLQQLEDFSGFSQAYIMYCNIEANICKKVGKGALANGVSASKDKTRMSVFSLDNLMGDALTV
jgi:hypothetical protein